MKEKTILTGIIVFVLIVCVYNHLLMSQPCQRKVVYFANEFDVVPNLKVVEENTVQEKTLQESMDDGIHMNYVIGKNKKPSTNLMISRWNGSYDTQPEKDSIGRTRHLDSVHATPVDFNPTIQYEGRFSKYVHHDRQRNKMGRSSKLEGLADAVKDNSNREDKALSLHLPSFHDTKFNTPNMYNSVSKQLNQNNQNNTQVTNQQMNMAYGSFKGMPNVM